MKARGLGGFLVVVAIVLGTATAALATDHTIQGSTTNERHQLIPLVDKALCDPSNSDPKNPDDINNFCRYAIRGKYQDTSEEGYLGTGRVNGRFTFDTVSFSAPLGEYGCFQVSSGVVKFTDLAGDRIRFKLLPNLSTICQVWDGTTEGTDGVRTSPSRTIHWEMDTTIGGCSGSFCGNVGSLVWDSTATFDDGNPGLFQYLDTASFSGTISSP